MGLPTGLSLRLRLSLFFCLCPFHLTYSLDGFFMFPPPSDTPPGNWAPINFLSLRRPSLCRLDANDPYDRTLFPPTRVSPFPKKKPSFPPQVPFFVFFSLATFEFLSVASHRTHIRFFLDSLFSVSAVCYSFFVRILPPCRIFTCTCDYCVPKLPTASLYFRYFLLFFPRPKFAWTFSPNFPGFLIFPCSFSRAFFFNIVKGNTPSTL